MAKRSFFEVPDLHLEKFALACLEKDQLIREVNLSDESASILSGKVDVVSLPNSTRELNEETKKESFWNLKTVTAVV